MRSLSTYKEFLTNSCQSDANVKFGNIKGKNTIDYSMDLVEYAEVAVAAGGAFGENGEGYVRIALVENEQRLRQAVRNISRFVREKPVRKTKQ